MRERVPPLQDSKNPHAKWAAKPPTFGALFRVLEGWNAFLHNFSRGFRTLVISLSDDNITAKNKKQADKEDGRDEEDYDAPVVKKRVEDVEYSSPLFCLVLFVISQCWRVFFEKYELKL